MRNKLFVGNLPFSLTEEELESMFAEHGAVTSAKLITDRDTGRPRGFGFVEFSDPQSAEAAVEALNGQVVGGRPIVVNEAKPRERRGFGGGRSDGYGSRGGGGHDRW